MAKPYKKSKRTDLNPDKYFVQLHKGFTKGKAWRALKVGPRALYIELKARYNSYNNGGITLSVREAAQALNCAPNTAQTYFNELQEHGFIKEREKGRLGVGGKGIATKWELTELGFMGARPTQDYKNWKPLKNKTPYQKLRQGVAKTDTLKGLGVAKIDTGVSKIDTGNAQNGLVPVAKIDTYIDSIPGGLAKPNKQDPAGIVSQSANLSHSRLAEKIGPNGWNLLIRISTETFESLLAKNESGALTDADIAAAELEAGENERGAVHA